MTANQWQRQVRSLLVKIHAARERAGLCPDWPGCTWWPR